MIESRLISHSEIPWKIHSVWARETIQQHLNMNSNRLNKSLLAELPKEPSRLSLSSIAMCTAFSYQLIEILASNKFESLNINEKELLIVRCISILLEAENRSKSVLSKKNIQDLLLFLESIETIQKPEVPLWAYILNDSNQLVESYIDSLFSKISVSFGVNNFENSKILEQIFSNEPFLAWKEIKKYSQKNFRSDFSLSHYFEVLSFGLFADPEMIKTVIRRSYKKNRSFEIHSMQFLFLILLARGDYQWLEDKTIFQPLQKRISHSDIILDKILRKILLLTTSKIESRFYKNILIKNILELILKLNKWEELLLCIGALHSFLRRNRFSLPSTKLSQLYNFFSEQLSKGVTTNLWDLLNGTDSNYKNSIQNASSIIPSSRIARTIEATSVTFKLTKLIGPRRLSKIITGNMQAVLLSEKEIDNLISIVVPYFSKIKGPLMKVGQTLSYTHFGLPHHHFEKLKSLQSDSEPLEFEIIFDLIKSNNKLISEIINIDTYPIGVGSIGQVHRAKLKDGRIVAIKVKFPDIEKIIQEDFQILRLITSMFELLNPSYQFKSFIDELERQLMLECDYNREGKSQLQHRSNMVFIESLYIPNIYLDLSNESILVSEFVEGMKFDEACRSGTQTQKDLWGKALVQYTVTACRQGHFNSDPHPGNLLFQKDRLVYLDFGSVREWNTKITDSWNYLIMSCLLGDPGLIYKAFDGFSNTRITQKNASDLVEILQNLMPGCWTYPGVQSLHADAIKKQMKNLSDLSNAKQSSIKIPKEFLFGTRVYFGHLSVVCSLGSVANWNELAHKTMEPWVVQNTLFRK